MRPYPRFACRRRDTDPDPSPLFFRCEHRTLPTRHFLSKPVMGEELSVIIDQGKSLLIKCLGTTPVNAVTGMREVLFELNGEARLIQIEDKNAATEVVRREQATKEPGSIGCEF